MSCPKCGSDDVSGLMAAFWVPITKHGDLKGEWRDMQSNTEITNARLCADCQHEWEDE